MTATPHKDPSLRGFNRAPVTHALPTRSPEYRRMARRLAARQSIGDLKAANDNAPWPLEAQLKRDKNEVLLAVAERYRAVYDAAEYCPQITGREPDTNMVLDTRTVNKEDGSVSYHGTRAKRTAPKAANDNAPVGAREDKKPVTFAPRTERRPVRAWNGDDPLLAYIDCARMLYRLRLALGALLEPFEDAVLHGETLSAVGAASGAMGKASRGAAGRALVMLGLEAAQRCFAEIDREARG